MPRQSIRRTKSLRVGVKGDRRAMCDECGAWFLRSELERDPFTNHLLCREDRKGRGETEQLMDVERRAQDLAVRPKGEFEQ